VVDRCGQCNGDGSTCVTFSPLRQGESRSPTLRGIDNPEKAVVRICVNAPMPTSDDALARTIDSTRTELAIAAGISRSRIPLGDVKITAGCANANRRQQSSDGYTVQVDITASTVNDFAEITPFEVYQTIKEQSNDPGSILRTGGIFADVIPNNVFLTCMTGCDGRQQCATSAGGEVDPQSLSILIMDPQGQCGGAAWCDGIPNSGKRDCIDFTPVPSYAPLPAFASRGPTTLSPRLPRGTQGPTLAPFAGPQTGPPGSIPTETVAPVSAPGDTSPPGTRPTQPPRDPASPPPQGGAAGSIVPLMWLSFALAALLSAVNIAM